MSLAISVEDVTKLYRLGEINRGQLFGDVRRWVYNRFNISRTIGDPEIEIEQEPNAPDVFYALKDISFDIKHGETVGFIGANGAGKSTLLKLISRITLPSTGTIRVNGRVGSLLEVGTGFHPELTGRDNVFMNGAILGMNRQEVRSKFDDIVSFAGVEKFIDTPVKRYSSGMYVRLAFSVAAFLEPEILIVDEVLSVGDQQFQNKCINRLQEVIKQGRTVLFVSHGAGLIRKICTRAICLKQGQIICDADPSTALDYYQQSQKAVLTLPSEEIDTTTDEASEAPEEQESPVPKPSPVNTSECIFIENNQPGDDVVKIQGCRILNGDGKLIKTARTNEDIIFEMDFRVLQDGYHLRPGANVYDELGNALFWTADTEPRLQTQSLPIGNYSATFVIPGDFLAPGMISFGAGVGEPVGIAHAYASDCVLLLVEDDMSESSVRGGYMGPLSGFVRPRLTWKTVRV